MKRTTLSILAALLLGCATARAPAGPKRVHGSAPERIAALREINKDGAVAEERWSTEQARELRARDAAAKDARQRRVDIVDTKKTKSVPPPPAPTK